MAAIGNQLEDEPLFLTYGRDFITNFENVDEYDHPLDFPEGDLFFELDTGGAHNAVHRVEVSGADDGTYTLTVENEDTAGSTHEKGTTDPIDWDAPTESPQRATDGVRSALEEVTGKGNVHVKSAKLFPVWMVEFELDAPLNEIQQISFTGNPSGGEFKLSFGLEMTDAIEFKSDPSKVKSALESLNGIGSGNVKVESDNNHGYIVEFVGDLAGEDQPQLGAYAMGIFLDFGLTGGFFPGVWVTTLVNGIGTIGHRYIDILNKYIKQFFDSFDELLGVDVSLVFYENRNIIFRVEALNGFDEIELGTLLFEVTNEGLKGFLNSISKLFQIFDILHVNFYWKRRFEVEFINEWATQPVTLSGDASGLEGTDDDQEVTVTTVHPGKNRFENWLFDLNGPDAELKVESERVNKIRSRTLWQLVFMPEGEEAGGQVIALGRVFVQHETKE